jgi:hypothetical protein
MRNTYAFGISLLIRRTTYNFLSFPELNYDLLTYYQTGFGQVIPTTWFIYDSLDL